MSDKVVNFARLALLASLAGCILHAAETKAAPQPLNYSVFSEYDRNLPGRTVSSGSSAHLFGAKGEYQAFQIGITAPAGATLLDAVPSALSNDRRNVIPATSLTIYREHYVRVDPASPDRNGSNRSQGAGSYPDALIPFRNPKTGRMPEGAYRPAPFRIDGKELLTLWVDVFIPRNAAQGEYQGVLTLSSDKGKVAVPLSVTVWGFTLPVKPSLQSSFAYWNAGGPDEIEELLRHKLMPQHGAGKQGPAVERRLASSSGLKMSDTGFWSGADNAHCFMKPAPSVKDLLASVASHDPGLSLFNYTADEVGNCKSLFPQIQEWGRSLHAAKIRNLVVMAPTPELLDAVDIWVMLPVQFEHPSPALAAARARGSEIWSYNALVQDSYSPKWLIDYDPIGYRLQAGFLSQSLGLTGLLYWRIDRWDGDPWKNVNNTGVFSSGNYPGDGMLVYPGAPAGVPGVVPSMRLKQLREGVQDYEYVQILKDLGRGSWALDRIRSVAPDWSKWTRKGADLEAVRRELAQEIQRLSK